MTEYSLQFFLTERHKRGVHSDRSFAAVDWSHDFAIFLYVDVSSCLSVMLTTELAKLKGMAGGSQSSSHTAKASRPATEHRGLFIVGYLAKAVRQ